MKKPEILGLIPARGGSKGIPGKNIMSIAGKPLIAYSILHAKKSKYISRVIVSTDDEDIANVSKEFGAEVPFMRPLEIAGDTSPDIDAFSHALKWLRNKESYNPELVVQLRPTGPVRKIEIIDKAIEMISKDQNADSLRSVSIAEQTPYKMWKIKKTNRMNPLIELDQLKDCQSLPRQKLPQVYWQNGYVDIIRPNTILKLNSMTGKNVIPFIINDALFELDYPEDIPEVERALLGKNYVLDKKITRHSV
tara:strand:- start:44 stop:793 length:750 start_codon:yes stop_codon:yes gene_type:complete